MDNGEYHIGVVNRFWEKKGAATNYTNCTNCTNGSRMLRGAFVQFVAAPSEIKHRETQFVTASS